MWAVFGTTFGQVMVAAPWLVYCALAASCGHPCRDLSDIICRCAQTAQQEEQCIRQVRALASQDRVGHDAASERRCAELLETCTCERLAAGDLAACGLATQAR